MRFPGVPYEPRYSTNEIATGAVLAVVLHVLAVGPFVARAILPHGEEEEEKPIVSRPVVQATLLKLGKPIDPKRLPDRLVPQQRTAPKKTAVASQEDPLKKLDAGPPPPNAVDSDIQNLVAKSDPFAEDASVRRPEEGHESGIDGGTETDPNKVKAGDMYNALLGQFFGQRLTVPTVISVGEARRLCTVYDIDISKNMVVWHLNQAPAHSSGNELFDDAARSMLMKLLDDKTPLPAPPPGWEEQYRGKRVRVEIPGDTHGGSTACPK